MTDRDRKLSSCGRAVGPTAAGAGSGDREDLIHSDDLENAQGHLAGTTEDQVPPICCWRLKAAVNCPRPVESTGTGGRSVRLATVATTRVRRPWAYRLPVGYEPQVLVQRRGGR